MGDVGILEAAHHMRDGVDLADVGEELVAEAFALGGAAHEAGDVDEGQPGRDDLRRFGDRRELVEPRIGHGDFADIRLDGAERIVRRLRRRRLGQRVEQGRLADIGQADDTAFESHDASRNAVASRRPCRAVLVLGQKSLRLQRQMHLVRERSRPCPSPSSAGVARPPPRTAPPPRSLSALAKSDSTWPMHQLLDAGMTDAEPHPAIVVADMRRDRAQAVVAGDAAADLDPHLRRRQFELVVEHGDVARRDLEEAGRLLHGCGRSRSCRSSA